MSQSDARRARRASSRELRRTYFRNGMMPRMNPRQIYAHEQVISVALKMAHEVYDELMTSDNELYADWKKQCPDLTAEKCEELFCQLMIPKLLEPARATLASMLAKSEFAHLHESIYDALCLDNILRIGRNAPKGRARIEIGEDGEAKVTRH